MGEQTPCRSQFVFCFGLDTGPEHLLPQFSYVFSLVKNKHMETNKSMFQASVKRTPAFWWVDDDKNKIQWSFRELSDFSKR